MPIAQIELDFENITKASNYYNTDLVNGMPVYWQYDVSGTMQTIIRAFLNRTETAEQLAMVIKFLRYFIHAPVWLETRPFKASEETEQKIKQLRDYANRMKTRAEVENFLNQCIDEGLDPL